MELIGRQFGNIRITEAVGQGGMGDVYAGWDQKLDRKVALKALHAEERLDEEARERLLREARALSKLDHPNICRIHDYIQSGDVDLLVLEFIDGRTLQEVIDDDKLSRAEKLRIAIAVAEVLVAAHRSGIVHRDLKPDNVMLTKSGEVKVLDFGLARWLKEGRLRSADRVAADAPTARVGVGTGEKGQAFTPTLALAPAGEDSRPLARPYIRPFLATEAGIALGTPLFMSPEQARGEKLTLASDMFAFGLLLQALFTGKDPHPTLLSAREVMLRVARGVTLPVENVSHDITVLINRLKQVAPADRPTAVEAVSRLRHIANRPARVARRLVIAAAALVVVLGVWRYVVDLRHERAAALDARVKLENNIEFMLGDLRKKLDAVGRLDILDDVGARALQYVDSLDPKTMTAADLTRNAKALNQLGEVRIGQGNTPEAFRMFEKSLTLSRAAVGKEPRNGDAQMVYGATHFWLGNAFRTQGDMKKALEHMSAYVDVGEKLAALDRNNKEYQLEKAYGHGVVGIILEQQGDLPRALERHSVSLGVIEELAARDPNDRGMQSELARAVNKLAVVQYKMGDLRASRAQSEREVGIYRKLVIQEPKQKQWKQRLATSIGYLARTVDEMGNPDAALALLREELAIEKELATLDPTNVSWTRSVARTSRWIARKTVERGDQAEALALIEEARQTIDDAILRAPTLTSLEIEKAVIDIDYSRILAAKDPRRAAALLRDAAERLQAERLQKGDGGRTARFELARALSSLGEIIQKTDPRAAEQAWRDAAGLIEPLVAPAASPGELAQWTRILIRTSRSAEARTAITRLRNTGYATGELEQLCRQSGC